MALADIVNRKDVWTVQRGRRAGFLLEAAEAISIDAEFGGQDLDGDVSAEPRVFRTINFAHPAGAPSGEMIS